MDSSRKVILKKTVFINILWLILLKTRMKTVYVEHGMIGGRSLKNAKNSNLKFLRANEIESAKERYQWQKIEGYDRTFYYW